jgi:hypothetical protein
MKGRPREDESEEERTRTGPSNPQVDNEGRRLSVIAPVTAVLPADCLYDRNSQDSKNLMSILIINLIQELAPCAPVNSHCPFHFLVEDLDF